MEKGQNAMKEDNILCESWMYLGTSERNSIDRVRNRSSRIPGGILDFITPLMYPSQEMHEEHVYGSLDAANHWQTSLFELVEYNLQPR